MKSGFRSADTGILWSIDTGFKIILYLRLETLGTILKLRKLMSVEQVLAAGCWLSSLDWSGCQRMTRSQPCVTEPAYHGRWLTFPCGEQIPHVNLWLWHVPLQAESLSIASTSQKRFIRSNGHFFLLITLQILFVLLCVFLWPCTSQ